MADDSYQNQLMSVSDRVLAFYRDLPFNQRDSVDSAVANVKAHDPVRTYPPLKKLVARQAVLEIGSGVGWFSNGLAYHHRSQCLGIDLNPVAVQRAQEVATELKVSTQFEVANLFEFVPPRRFPLVVSLGVLHHTADCHGAISRICHEFLEEDGRLMLGLYHSHGRRPFLEYFRQLQRQGASEDALLAEYGRLHQISGDVTHLRSWFRDQVLHPHETQHTYLEIRALLESLGLHIVSTSINKFQQITSHRDIETEEVSCSEISKQAIRDGRYYPGFFVVMAERTTSLRGY